MKLCVGENFYQLVHDYLGVWNILEVDLSNSHFVINIVILDVTMLYLSGIDKIVDKGNRSLIVACERNRDVY